MTSSTAERRRPARTRLAAGLLAAFALLAAPHAGASTLAEEEARLSRAAPNDRTLHRLQAGVLALREQRLDASAAHFDEALDAIESVFSNAEGAARARSLWYEEGAKDYKGEPYERAMAFYYRGLLYLAEADYENARASFRSALMQSSFAEEQQYRSGFASLMFLEGWCSQLLGDRSQAAEAYAEARKYRPDWQPPAADANTLVVAELGGSPRKVGDGIGNHEIVYRRAKRTPERRIDVALGERLALRLYAMEDLYEQATHRGERAIDRIIDGKVTFQKTAATVGDVAGTIASEGSVIAAALGNGNGGSALGGLAAVGAIASLVAVNVKPRADVRYWSNLPESLHFAALPLADLSDVAFTLQDEAGQPVATDGAAVHRFTDRRGNRLVWIKTRR
jgi:tetratricopeptide (TPR) repeat protein